MKYLISILVLFTAAVALSSLLQNTAYVLLVYPPYRIEFSLKLLVFVLLLAFVFGQWLIHMLAATSQLPGVVKRMRFDRAQKKARKLLDVALSAFFEGRYAEAEKIAVRAIKLGETSALYPIIAARSAHELEATDRRDAYLSVVGSSKSPGDTTMRFMATAKFKLDQHDQQGALNALQELRNSGAKVHVGVLSLELKAQQEAGNWDEVLNVLEQMERRKVIDAALAEPLRKKAWLGNIQRQHNLADLDACLKRIPANLKRSTKVAAAAARALIEQGDDTQAQHLLTDSLNAQWSSDLVALYGDCHSSDALAQIEQAETWLEPHKDDAWLWLALGKLCLNQKLWGKAQTYLEESIRLSPSHAGYILLAKLAEQLGEADEAARYKSAAALLKQ